MRSPKTSPRKSPGRPTAEHRARAVRLPDELLDKVDAWADSQKAKPNRPDAIRLLLESALSKVAGPRRAASRRSGDRATELASDAIDRLGDAGATSEVRASRKGTLMKGPEEFRGLRRDRPHK